MAKTKFIRAHVRFRHTAPTSRADGDPMTVLSLLRVPWYLFVCLVEVKMMCKNTHSCLGQDQRGGVPQSAGKLMDQRRQRGSSETPTTKNYTVPLQGRYTDNRKRKSEQREIDQSLLGGPTKQSVFGDPIKASSLFSKTKDSQQ